MSSAIGDVRDAVKGATQALAAGGVVQYARCVEKALEALAERIDWMEDELHSATAPSAEDGPGW